MREELILRLQRHRDRLVREIDTVGLWTNLYQMKVITRQHMDMCKSMTTYAEQLEVLLDTLEKRDDDCFEGFCSAVRQNNPELVSRYLERETVAEEKNEVQYNSGSDCRLLELRRTALNLEKENEKLSNKLDRLKKMKTWLQDNTKFAELKSQMERQKLKEIDEKIQQNQRKYKIRLYELTARRKNRERLELTVKRLREERETLEAETVSRGQAVVTLTEDLEKATKRNVQLKRDLYEIKKTNANSLDVSDQLPSSSSFLTLLPPQDLNRLDTNQQFIMEACGDLSKRELIPVLTALDGAAGSRRTSFDLERESVDQLFNVIRSFSPDNYDSFLSCLRRLNHHHIADVLDYGGVAVKLIVMVRLDENARRRNPIERLNDVSNRDIINSAFTQCGCAKTKFLCARLSHPMEASAIQMWVWCMSEDDLTMIKNAVDNRILLKQFKILYQKLAISEGGFFGNLMTSGKPTSIVFESERELMRTFCPCQPFGRIVRRLPALVPGRVAVIGVASLGDRAYVLCSASTQIHVFQLENSVYSAKGLPPILVPNLRNPVDMTGLDGWLYVLERETELFWKLNVASGTPSPPEKCDVGVRASSFSVTPDGHLLLSVRGPRNLMLLCRTADGRPVREIGLPGNTDSIWHGLVTASGEFVVTRRCEGLHQVALLDAAGKLRKDYSGSTRLSLPPLDTPVHVTVDEEGQLFVADQMNARVLYFDPDLQSVRVLVNVEFGRPNRMCFNQDNGHLFVGLDNGSVEIYSVNETKYLETLNDEDRNDETERDADVLCKRNPEL